MRSPARTQTHLNTGARLGPCGGVRIAIAVMVVCLATPASAGPLSPEEARGKQTFLTGSSAAGREITAFVGQSSVPVPASAMPCASCHGADGIGRPEGGVIPANITWSHLTKPYGTVSARGRRRPAYTEETAARAISAGIDSAGGHLDVSMPRFRMDPQDMADLIAYLRRLEHDRDPGLTDKAITLGTVLPQGGPGASLGEAIQGVVTASFDEINEQGGVYNRRLELKVTGAPTRDLVLARAAELIESGAVFALVAAVTAGVEREFGKMVDEHQIPLVGPFTQFPRGAETLQRFTFYLLSGLTIQAKALLDYASRKLALAEPRIGVVYPRDENTRAVAKAIRAQAEKLTWPEPLLIDYLPRQMNAAAVATRLEAAGTNAVLFLGPSAELAALASEGSRRDWVPYVFLAGSLAGRGVFDLPAAFQGRVFVAYPSGPADYTKAGAAEFTAFHRRHNLPRQHMAAQIAAYAAVKLLVEGLKAAGQSVSREKLVSALEKLYEFNTGLTPILTYGPNRRIGARGAHIVALDLEKRRFGPRAEWIAPR